MSEAKWDILHIYKDYYPVLGGIENHIRVIAEAQAARGHKVTVLVTSQHGPTTAEDLGGVHVIRARRLATVASAPLSPTLVSILREMRPDILHLHSPYPVAETAYLLTGRARVSVLTYHSDVVRQKNILRFYLPIFWRVLYKVNAIIATSENYVHTSPYLQRVRNKCVVIPLGTDIDRIANADKALAQAIRVRYGEPLLLFVGKLRYYKGVQYLIAALPQLPDVKLLVVGTGPMEEEWRALAAKWNVAERVIFTGEVPDEDLPAYYHAADLFVLPACERSEAFGTVLLEAMAAGLPLVTTEVGTGTSWVNQDGVTGLIVPPRDPIALADAIHRLLDDTALRREMGHKAFDRVRNDFTQDVMVERILALYHQLLAD